MEDLHQLPQIRDRLSSLYVEHARIDRHEKSIAIWNDEGFTPVPAAALTVLMLGPGTKITHSAITTLADNSCLVVWCGEENVRFYAAGTGGTRSAYGLLKQARLASDPLQRLEVVKRMYRMRFQDALDNALSVEQLRGMEGVRVREAYARASRETGVAWAGRSYDRSNWASADPVNRALSCGNACLYGICHAAILATGYSPAIGFIHTGKQLSFVYDIADLYKVELTIPLAFQAAGDNPSNLERWVRHRCRDTFRESKLLQRIVPDIKRALGGNAAEDEPDFAPDTDPALPTELWTPDWEREGEGQPPATAADLE
ncbi:MAG TPA: type I-E CRISPR-associated endonuclease Cas1e [Chthonomonadaceae bacterium]|nr:type I-E CRISPR-associated endonuclease Cas1e [Chthonomonadaceae bacterium]